MQNIGNPMTFPIQPVIFFFFSGLLIMAALMVILVRNPVHAVLFLVLSFFASAILWMLLQAEFLSLVLIFVYVGAVMTLFLFVVMMINIDLTQMRRQFVRYLPVGLLVMALLVALLLMMLFNKRLTMVNLLPVHYGQDYNNTRVMGEVLFTRFLYPFELAAVLLLVAIVAAISLAFHGRRANTKVQTIALQHAVDKKDRLKIIKM